MCVNSDECFDKISDLEVNSLPDKLSSQGLIFVYHSVLFNAHICFWHFKRNMHKNMVRWCMNKDCSFKKIHEDHC